MKRTNLIAVLVVLAAIAIFTTDASAMYHPTMGRFISRDPGPGGGSAAPVTGSRFIPRDPTGTGQYADGMNLYQYCISNPVIYTDIDGMRPTHPMYELADDGTRTGVRESVLTDRDLPDVQRRIVLDNQIVLSEQARKHSRNVPGEVSVRIPMPGTGIFVVTYKNGEHLRTVFPGRRIVGVDWDCFLKCFDRYSSSVIFQVPGVGAGAGGSAAWLTTPTGKPAGVTKLGRATERTTRGSRLFGRWFRNLMKRPAAKTIGVRAATGVGRVGSKFVPIAGWVLLAWDGGAAYGCLLKCPKEICVMPDGTVKEVKNK